MVNLCPPRFVGRLELAKNKLTWLAAMPLLTSALLCACLTTKFGADCCFIALVPLALAIVAREVPRSVYASAFLTGLVVHLVGMAWVLECYRYDDAVGPYAVQWFWIGTWGGALFVGLLFGGRYIQKRRPMPMTFLLPILWVTYEFIRHEMAEIVTGTGFPWLKLGTAVIDSPVFVQIADLGGEYLLSFLVAMICGGIVDFSRLLAHKNTQESRAPMIWAVTFSFVCVVLVNGYGIWRSGQSTGEPGPAVGLLGDSDLPPLLEAKRLKNGFGSEADENRHADLLLWPELAYHHIIAEATDNVVSDADKKRRFLTVGLSRLDENSRGRRYLEQAASNFGVTLVIGCERRHLAGERVKTYNSLACVDPMSGYQGCYDKVNLVPGAETSMRSSEAFQGDYFNYSRGNRTRIFSVPTESRCYRFATAICYDLCFGRHFQQQSLGGIFDERPEFLVQCGAEGQDAGDVVATRMLQYAKLRAIENRRALVRNVIFGYSALIDGNGVIRTALPATPIENPTWLGAVPIDDRYSFYAYAGDWIAYFSCIAMATLTMLRPRVYG